MGLFIKKIDPVTRIYRKLDELEMQSNNWQFQTLKKEAVKWINENKKDINNWEGTEDYKKFNPFGWCCDLMADMGISMLRSGEYHLHRGVLNPMKGGPELKQCIIDLIEKSVSYDFYTEEEKEKILNTIEETIRGSG